MSNIPKFRRRAGSGIDAFSIIKLTDTSLTMIEKNYGHLKKDVVKEKLDTMTI